MKTFSLTDYFESFIPVACRFLFASNRGIIRLHLTEGFIDPEYQGFCYTNAFIIENKIHIGSSDGSPRGYKHNKIWLCSCFLD